jgi:hypothetical protein
MSEYLKLRIFENDKDTDMVSAWWVASGRNPVHPSEFTHNGIVAVVDGKDVAAAWLYVNNRSRVATVENLVSDPGADEDHVKHGTEIIFDFFRKQSEEIGKEMEIDEPFKELQLSLCGGPQTGDDVLDQCEDIINSRPEQEMPVTHTFTPGMYIRQIFIPARTILTSRIHLTEHPFVISKGDISVWTAATGTQRFKAPYSGVTKPGTRRLLFAHDDTIWTTFHATDETDVEKITNAITTTRTIIEEGSQCLSD